MNEQAPILSARDLEEELRRIHERRHRSLTTAFYGKPSPEAVELKVTLNGDAVRFRVEHATCELMARKALAGAGDQPLALLVDFTDRLPLDILGRVAGGKVRYITEERRLARLFGARAVSPEVLMSPLKHALLADSGSSYAALPGTTLDLDTAWRRYLERMAGIPMEAAFSEERVVAHCALWGDPTGFARILGARDDLRAALHQYLEDRAGPVATIAWRAWERGRGLEVAVFALVLGAVVPQLLSSEYLRAWLNLRLAQLDPELKNAVGQKRALLERWAGLCDRLSLQFEDARFDPIVQAADRLLSEDDNALKAIGPSRYLDTALASAKDRLAEALEQAVSSKQPSRVAPIRDQLAALDGHRRRDRQPHRSQLDRARMAARLAAWLLARKEEPAAATSGDEVAQLATEYAREGGWVDWARTVARGPLTDPLDRAIAAVLERADAVRDAANDRFAHALPGWLARRKSDRVVPIDEALERFGVDFLEGGSHRRLLVLLMDGMAWTNAVELLLDLESRHRIGPLRWQPKGSSGELLPPMLAALPTLTGVSRSAFFAGRLIKPSDRLDTSQDPDRFDGHKGLRKLLGHGPRLLLRTQAEDRPGHATKEALDLVASDERVVGLVVNAIDDHLKSGPGLDVAFRVETIKALPDVLGAATQASRAILLVADHGHVRSDRFGAVKRSSGLLSARCRELGPDEEPAEGELVVDGPGAWRPHEARKLIMLQRESDTYAGGAHRGEHGGAALSEVVAPAVLIGSDELVRNLGVRDPEMDLRPFPRPAWWDLEVAETVVAAVIYVPATQRPTKVTPQLSIPLIEPIAPTVPSSAPSPDSRIVGLLRSNELYTSTNKREREFWDKQVLPMVDLLALHDGSIPEDQLAARFKVLKFRVPGLVASVGERLNLEQHLVLVHDRMQGLVRLDLLLLEQLFAEG